jgi:hypothetical protein
MTSHIPSGLRDGPPWDSQQKAVRGCVCLEPKGCCVLVQAIEENGLRGRQEAEADAVSQQFRDIREAVLAPPAETAEELAQLRQSHDRAMTALQASLIALMNFVMHRIVCGTK